MQVRSTTEGTSVECDVCVCFEPLGSGLLARLERGVQGSLTEQRSPQVARGAGTDSGPCTGNAKEE